MSEKKKLCFELMIVLCRNFMVQASVEGNKQELKDMGDIFDYIKQQEKVIKESKI